MAEEKQAEQQKPQSLAELIGPPTTATWKISQETFRKLARTGATEQEPAS